MKKIAGIYDPYLDTLGGGERYCLSIVEILLSLGYEVDIFWSGDQELLKKAQKRFDLKIEGAKFVPDIFKIEPNHIDEIENPESVITIASHSHRHNKISQISNFINKIKVTRSYDLFFYLSDWSVPFIFSKNNLLHVQVPFVIKLTLKTKALNFIKSLLFNKVVCNSQFTSSFAQKYFGSKCIVLYPPVDVVKFQSTAIKSNIILSVGRFDNILNSKKQEVMINAFKSICLQQKDSGWKLVLAGGSLASPDKNTYLQHLQHLAKDLPVEFVVNPDFPQLQVLYGQSKIYWHAAGFGVDQTTHPESTEHFGMAPVEAMASGCVPILVNKGGLPEIVTDKVDGYLWDSESELIAKTQLLMNSPDTLLQNSKAAIAKSQNFSKEKFSTDLQKLLK